MFATADDQFALQAFELNALDYILKPFEEERIRQTLDKIKKYRIQSPVSGPRHTASHTRTDTRPELHSKIAIPQGERLILLETGEIVYAGSEEGKCVVKTAQQRYEFEGTLVELEKKLPSELFVRVHRSYIVNGNGIDEIEPWFNGTYNVYMKDGSRIPVSRTFVRELKQMFGL